MVMGGEWSAECGTVGMKGYMSKESWKDAWFE